jgi:hypothetical protein
MSTHATFDEVLDAVENLPDEQQQDLVEVVQRRLAERGRKQVAADVADARAEFAAGKAKPTDVDSLMREIES